MNATYLVQMALAQIAGASLSLFLWTAVIVFGVILQRRGPDRSIRFLVAGAALKLGSTVLAIAWGTFFFWLFAKNPDSSMATLNTAIGVVIDVISAAGLLLLFYAFWLKVRPGAAPTARPPELVQ